MARPRRGRKRPYHEAHVPLDPERIGAIPRSEPGPGGESYTVRPVRGGDKSYRCPGCNQLIAPGTPHLVAWPTDPMFGDGTESRRHWHTACWSRR